MEITNCRIKMAKCEYVLSDDEKEKGLIIFTIVVENSKGDFKIDIVEPNQNTAYQFFMTSIFHFAAVKFSSELNGKILRMAINSDKEVVAFGDPIKDEFVLMNNQVTEFKLLTEKELRKKFG